MRRSATERRSSTPLERSRSKSTLLVPPMLQRAVTKSSLSSGAGHGAQSRPAPTRERSRSSFGMLSFGGSAKLPKDGGKDGLASSDVRGRERGVSCPEPPAADTPGAPAPPPSAEADGATATTLSTGSDGEAAPTPRAVASAPAEMTTSGTTPTSSLSSAKEVAFEGPPDEAPRKSGGAADAAGEGTSTGGAAQPGFGPPESAPRIARCVTTATATSSRSLAKAAEEVHILMGDLVTGMRQPCAMSFLMGVRTVTPADFEPAQATPHAALLESMRLMAPERAAEMLTAEEAQAGAVPLHRYLEFLDTISSSRTLGFRIDAAKTVVDGTPELLPLPEGKTLTTLADEAQNAEAIATFLQRDALLAAATLLKLQTLESALVRSSFFARHAFLRTTMLLVFDDAHRDTSVDLKIMNFSSSYALPKDVRVTHTDPWDGTAECHEDGYLTGVRSLLRVVKSVCDALAPPTEAPPATADPLPVGPEQVQVTGMGVGGGESGEAAPPRRPPPPGRGLRR